MLLDRFLEHLAYEKRSSALTVQAYRRDLEQFAAFLQERIGPLGPEQANDKAVRAWMMQLMEGGTGARSVNRKLSALRAFYHFGRTVGAVGADSMRCGQSLRLMSHQRHSPWLGTRSSGTEPPT